MKWFKRHRKESGVFTTVTSLVNTPTDNSAAKLAAEETLERVQQAQP